MTSRRVQYKNFVDEFKQKAKNRVKARVRASVQIPFRILKRILRIREGERPRDSEEPSSAVRQLCAGEPVPHRGGSGEAVVSLKAACMAG